MQVSALHQQSAQWVMPAQGKSSAEREKDASPVDNAATKGAQSSPANNDSSGSIKSKPTTSDTLSQEQLDMITQLKARDAEVRAHEAAHLAAAGSYATSGANYSTQKGPDGRAYAIGGEVGIDTSAVPNDPEATMRKADVVVRAALAPAEPSGQDMKVAQAAQQMRVQAMVELSQQRADKVQGKDNATQDAPASDKNSAEDTNASSTESKTPDAWRSAQAKDRYQSTMNAFKGTGYHTIGFAAQA